MTATLTQSRVCNVYDLGMIDFHTAALLQEKLVQLRLAEEIPDVALFLQHTPVITMGASGQEEDIIVSRGLLVSKGMLIARADRGGNVTYHGPGQLIGYFIFDLNHREKDLHKYLHNLEEVAIRTLSEFSIKSCRDPKYPGVWVGSEKICALGIGVKRWVTKHGFALNVNNDLKPFSYIRPCGIADRGVTSLSQLLGCEIDIKELMMLMFKHLSQVLDTTIKIQMPRSLL